ncbi:hypothetical protein NADFUDRAFT_40676 [Nadsonia fulvescens var. elongata DSM 6958]|uniref:BRCT domain-containing protein n=1 Tax=Nadsonia fulvescens var. elongata DSM 6958 TaxID=857566 RepID=A0A1E3PQ02_9ASCO|nr:hypothetical protein NADFUDRAFT_40676 [Nadsonia fulvescens var. elongata DSM 6958]
MNDTLVTTFEKIIFPVWYMSRIKLDLSAAPLTGRVFCCTSICSEKYTEIASKCKAMGGTCREDLRNDVMYLIVGARHTPKYEYATKNRFDIKFLTPESITSLHEKWINGYDITNIEDELAKHKLPVFQGLLITCTNITDNNQRQEIISLVESHGGKFLSDLTKTVNVVISPVKREGAKYEWAQKWNIPIVHPNWARSSINVGASLEVSNFSLNIDPRDMFTGITPRNQSNRGLLSTRFDDDEEEHSAQLMLPDNHLKVKVNEKRKRSSNKVWDDLMEVADAEVDSFTTKGFVDKWKDDIIDVDESKIKAIEEEIDKHDDSKTILTNIEEKAKSAKRGIFSGLIFQFYGFDTDQTSKLTHVVSTNGAFVFDIRKTLLHSEDPTHIIINSLASRNTYNELLEVVPNSLIIPKIKTEWFIERSLEKRKCIDDIWGDFIKVKPIPAFKNILISVSGYCGTELLHLERLISLIGANFDPIFTPNNNLLISTKNSRKLLFSRQWHIPAIREAWLWACAKTGKLLPITDHLDPTKYNWLLKGQDILSLQLGFLEKQRLATDASEKRASKSPNEKKTTTGLEKSDSPNVSISDFRMKIAKLKNKNISQNDPISDDDICTFNRSISKKRRRLESAYPCSISSPTFQSNAHISLENAKETKDTLHNQTDSCNFINGDHSKTVTNLDKDIKVFPEVFVKNSTNTRLAGRSLVSATGSLLTSIEGDDLKAYSDGSLINSTRITNISTEAYCNQKEDHLHSKSIVGYSDPGSAEKTTLLQAFDS